MLSSQKQFSHIYTQSPPPCPKFIYKKRDRLSHQTVGLFCISVSRILSELSELNVLSCSLSKLLVLVNLLKLCLYSRSVALTSCCYSAEVR